MRVKKPSEIFSPHTEVIVDGLYSLFISFCSTNRRINYSQNININLVC